MEFCQGREATEGKQVMEEGSSAYVAWDLRPLVEAVCSFPEQTPQGQSCSGEASHGRRGCSFFGLVPQELTIYPCQGQSWKGGVTANPDWLPSSYQTCESSHGIRGCSFLSLAHPGFFSPGEDSNGRGPLSFPRLSPQGIAGPGEG